jgi:TfoX/Sxy family transcriptional regulator of competence genes
MYPEINVIFMPPMKKGGFPTPSLAMAELLAEHMSAFECEKRKMFGHPCYFVHGNMFTGVFSDKIFARFSEEDRRHIDSEGIGVLFEPAKGRSMKEYRVLSQKVLDDPKIFDQWLTRSFAYSSSLPPKE